MLEIKEINSFADATACLDLLGLLYDKRKNADEIKKELEEMYQNYHYMLLLAVVDGQAVGVCGLSFNMLLYTGKFMQVSNLFILPDYRKMGIAAQFIAQAEQIALRNQVKTIMLDSYTTNFNSHKTYFRAGFKLKAFHFIKELD